MFFEQQENTPPDTRRKLNVRKTFRRPPGFEHLMYVHFTSCIQGDLGAPSAFGMLGRAGVETPRLPIGSGTLVSVKEIPYIAFLDVGVLHMKLE